MSEIEEFKIEDEDMGDVSALMGDINDQTS